MNIWIRIAVEIPAAFVAAGMGHSYWSLRRLPKLLLERLCDDVAVNLSYMDFLPSGTGTKDSKSALDMDSKTHQFHLMLDMSSSLDSWRSGRRVAFFLGLLLVGLSYILGAGFSICTALAFLCPIIMRTDYKALRSVDQLIISILARISIWSHAHPEECRRFCTEIKPRYFHCAFTAIHIDEFEME